MGENYCFRENTNENEKRTKTKNEQKRTKTEEATKNTNKTKTVLKVTKRTKIPSKDEKYENQIQQTINK